MALPSIENVWREDCQYQLSLNQYLRVKFRSLAHIKSHGNYVKKSFSGFFCCFSFIFFSYLLSYRVSVRY